jgi:RNA polymerase sigma-70 factor (ECF subfamily)
VLSIREGDPTAEEQFAKYFTGRVFLAIMSRIRNREVARELAQDVIVAALCALRNGHVRQPEKLAAFVYGTTQNTVKNHRRSQARLPTQVPFSPEVAVSDCPDVMDDPGEAHLMRQALGLLDPTDRGILLMTLVEGLRPAEIAQRLGLSPELVRKRKSRAIQKVTKQIRKKMSRKGP